MLRHWGRTGGHGAVGSGATGLADVGTGAAVVPGGGEAGVPEGDGCTPPMDEVDAPGVPGVGTVPGAPGPGEVDRLGVATGVHCVPVMAVVIVVTTVDSGGQLAPYCAHLMVVEMVVIIHVVGTPGVGVATGGLVTSPIEEDDTTGTDPEGCWGVAGEVDGCPGPTGVVGCPGVTGAVGWLGVPGVVGWPGVTGVVGWPGVAGAVGCPGVAGDVGCPGVPGVVDGRPGVTGVDGCAGTLGVEPGC